MRDKLKPREYFDAFIIQEQKRVEKFESRLASGTVKADRILPVKDALLQIKLNIISAKYSRGDEVEALRADFLSLIELFLDCWERDSYEDNLKIAALCCLFEVDDEAKKKVGEKLKTRPYYDPITDFILYGNKSAGMIANISIPALYSKLAESIVSESVEKLEEYLHGWYTDHDDSPWYDSHKSRDVAIYSGYWCFEAAAAAKQLVLDDEKLKDEPYYPYDMIDRSAS